MALVKTFDANDLLEEFKAWNRDYYTYEACEEIVNFFEETDCGQNTELDIIGICCDFNEQEAEDIYNEYDNLDDIAECKDEDGEIDKEKLFEALQEHTWAIELTNGNILYLNF